MFHEGQAPLLDEPTRPMRKRETTRPREDVIQFEIKEGQVLTDDAGHTYSIVEKLGEGGMGAVFKVKDEQTEMIRAIKFLNNRQRDVPSAVKRFEREIRVLGQLDNPFILAPFDAAHFELEGEQVVGLVTDFVNGPNLEREIKKEGWIKPERLVTLGAQLASALETLRKAKIVHRDLKPANIFLEKMPNGEEFVRIGDFGIAGFDFESEHTVPQDDRLRDLRGEQLTDIEFLVGTPQFMSPEAVRGGIVDHRSDLYSLGIVLYQMVVGKVPFSDSPPHIILRQQMSDTPESFARQGAKDMPKWIEDIVQRLLQKNPQDRYQSAAEVFVALKEGVAKHYPKLLNEIPFIWDLKPEETLYDDAPTQLAA